MYIYTHTHTYIPLQQLYTSGHPNDLLRRITDCTFQKWREGWSKAGLPRAQRLSRNELQSAGICMYVCVYACFVHAPKLSLNISTCLQS